MSVWRMENGLAEPELMTKEEMHEQNSELCGVLDTVRFLLDFGNVCIGNDGGVYLQLENGEWIKPQQSTEKIV